MCTLCWLHALFHQIKRFLNTQSETGSWQWLIHQCVCNAATCQPKHKVTMTFPWSLCYYLHSPSHTPCEVLLLHSNLADLQTSQHTLCIFGSVTLTVPSKKSGFWGFGLGRKHSWSSIAFALAITKSKTETEADPDLLLQLLCSAETVTTWLAQGLMRDPH